MTEQREAAVTKYLNGKLQFETLKQRIGEKDAEAVRESKKQLSQVEDLAEEVSKLQNECGVNRILLNQFSNNICTGRWLRL